MHKSSYVLREKFGEKYEAYSREVPMLLPKLPCVFEVLFGINFNDREV